MSSNAEENLDVSFLFEIERLFDVVNNSTITDETKKRVLSAFRVFAYHTLVHYEFDAQQKANANTDGFTIVDSEVNQRVAAFEAFIDYVRKLNE